MLKIRPKEWETRLRVMSERTNKLPNNLILLEIALENIRRSNYGIKHP